MVPMNGIGSGRESQSERSVRHLFVEGERFGFGVLITLELRKKTKKKTWDAYVLNPP